MSMQVNAMCKDGQDLHARPHFSQKTPSTPAAGRSWPSHLCGRRLERLVHNRLGVSVHPHLVHGLPSKVQQPMAKVE